jgi:hypothetical protein
MPEGIAVSLRDKNFSILEYYELQINPKPQPVGGQALKNGNCLD